MLSLARLPLSISLLGAPHPRPMPSDPSASKIRVPGPWCSSRVLSVCFHPMRWSHWYSLYPLPCSAGLCELAENHRPPFTDETPEGYRTLILCL